MLTDTTQSPFRDGVDHILHGNQALTDVPWCVSVTHCITFLASLKEGTADVVFADPPYFASGKKSTTAKGGKRAKIRHGSWDAPIGGPEAELDFHRRWLAQARRVMKPAATVWVCGNYKSIGPALFALEVSGFRLLNMVVWNKPNAAPNLGCRQLTHSSEFIAWASLGPKARHYFDYKWAKHHGGGKQLRDVWTIPVRLTPADVEHGRHPTHKPLALVLPAIHLSAPIGGLVVDPFCGSGVAGVAALARGCRYVACDADSDHAALAARRLSSWRGK